MREKEIDRDTEREREREKEREEGRERSPQSVTAGKPGGLFGKFSSQVETKGRARMPPYIGNRCPIHASRPMIYFALITICKIILVINWLISFVIDS